MDLNYVLSDLSINERIEARRRDAGALHYGTGSAMVAMIGRSAVVLSRAADRVAAWANGNSEIRTGTARGAF
ncbi:hypothetical protein J0H33_05010 [bacterium]|jgi:hypothetical protein|nr:hypothetical protein [bacterium]